MVSNDGHESLNEEEKKLKEEKDKGGRGGYCRGREIISGVKKEVIDEENFIFIIILVLLFYLFFLF